MITLSQAKALKKGQRLTHTINKNVDGTAQRWVVTSVKVWVRSPSKVRIGLKHGLYTYGAATENDLDMLNL